MTRLCLILFWLGMCSAVAAIWEPRLNVLTALLWGFPAGWGAADARIMLRNYFHSTDQK